MTSYFVKEQKIHQLILLEQIDHTIENTNINDISDEVKKAKKVQYHGTVNISDKFCINNQIEELILVNEKNKEYNIDKLINLYQIYHLSLSQFNNPPNLFHNFNNLTSLSLSHSKLTEIPNSIFQLKDLQLLGLSNNNITKIPIELKKFKKLKELFLQYNQINIFPEWMINYSKKLIYLMIQNNNIKYFPSELIYSITCNNMYICISNQLFIDKNIIDNKKYYKINNCKKYFYMKYYNLENNINNLSDKCIKCNKIYPYMYRVSFIGFKYTPEFTLATQIFNSKKQYLWQEYVYMCRKCKEKNKITEFVY